VLKKGGDSMTIKRRIMEYRIKYGATRYNWDSIRIWLGEGAYLLIKIKAEYEEIALVCAISNAGDVQLLRRAGADIDIELLQNGMDMIEHRARRYKYVTRIYEWHDERYVADCIEEYSIMANSFMDLKRGGATDGNCGNVL
jgi:hypothetical protein